MDNVVTEDDVWIPSAREMGWTWYESSGHAYEGIFTSNDSRKKSKVGATDSSNWWLRSASGSSSFYIVRNNGSNYNYNADRYYGVALGFCT